MQFNLFLSIYYKLLTTQIPKENPILLLLWWWWWWSLLLLYNYVLCPSAAIKVPGGKDRKRMGKQRKETKAEGRGNFLLLREKELLNHHSTFIYTFRRMTPISTPLPSNILAWLAWLCWHFGAGTAYLHGPLLVLHVLMFPGLTLLLTHTCDLSPASLTSYIALFLFLVAGNGWSVKVKSVWRNL